MTKEEFEVAFKAATDIMAERHVTFLALGFRYGPTDGAHFCTRIRLDELRPIADQEMQCFLHQLVGGAEAHPRQDAAIYRALPELKALAVDSWLVTLVTHDRTFRFGRAPEGVYQAHRVLDEAREALVEWSNANHKSQLVWQ